MLSGLQVPTGSEAEGRKKSLASEESCSLILALPSTCVIVETVYLVEGCRFSASLKADFDVYNCIFKQFANF